ncbi:hypothetical protein FB451DRAFT_1233268 [Mycena latifolia]|nr:hypothetical protein FB451DRAFT_1233268 [Mycena latifolia]
MGAAPFRVCHDISASDVADAHRWISLLFVVANSPAIISLFSLPSLSMHFILKASIGPESVNVDDPLNEDEVGLIEEEGISNGVKFLRHLGMLACSYSAISYFLRPHKLPNTVRIQIFCIAEPPREDNIFRSIDESIRARAVDRIWARAPDGIRTGERLEDLRTQPRRPSDTSHVHCEASILALVGQGNPELIMPQTASDWPIGASRKCCWACWKLGELLGQDVPIWVLEHLRDALLEAYADACQEELNIFSPAPPVSPILDFDPVPPSELF